MFKKLKGFKKCPMNWTFEMKSIFVLLILAELYKGKTTFILHLNFKQTGYCKKKVLFYNNIDTVPIILEKNGGPNGVDFLSIFNFSRKRLLPIIFFLFTIFLFFLLLLFSFSKIKTIVGGLSNYVAIVLNNKN